MDSEAAPESIAAPAIANGADGSSQGAGEADPVTNEGSPSDAEIVAKLKEYLADSSMNMNVTERQLRQSLESHFGTPLKSQKALIRSEVMDWLAAKQREEAKATADQDEAEEEPAAKPKKGRGPRPSLLSEAMQNFLGAERMPRTQVVKRIWEYIKANNLQKPEDRRYIILDEKLSTVFKNPLTAFSMNKQLSKHLYIDDTYEGINDTANGAASRKRKQSNPAGGGKRQKSGEPKKSAITRPLKLSPELQDLFGAKTLSRPQLTKKFFEYVNQHQLQDPSNKRFVLSDAKLKALVGEDRFLAFSVTKYLKPHILGFAEEEDAAEPGENGPDAAGVSHEAGGSPGGKSNSESAGEESDDDEELSD